MITPLRIASSPQTVLANIERFGKEVGQSPALQARLAYARAWYADQNSRGEWQFGPSKYVGYDGLSEALKRFDYDSFLYPKRVVFGDPDQCVERIRELEAWGVTHMGLLLDFGGLAPAKIFASIERLRKYVIPRFS